MTRATIVAALAAFAGLSATVTASATTTQRLVADLHDNLACPAGFDLCGKGVLHGFGTVTTTLTFTGFGPGPDNCVSVTADRVLTLDADGSTLDLSVAGVLCPQGNSGGHAPARDPERSPLSAVPAASAVRAEVVSCRFRRQAFPCRATPRITTGR